MHDVFHDFGLKDCVYNPTHIIDFSDLTIRYEISFEDRPVRVLNKEQILRNKVISVVKVLWTQHGIEEATSECEAHMIE